MAAAFAAAVISGDGANVSLPTIEETITVPGTIISALYERAVWRAWSENWGAQYESVRSAVMAEYGKKGGRSKSAAKSSAARANGVKGGRPRKRPPAAGE
jgi:hypothetical protein